MKEKQQKEALQGQPKRKLQMVTRQAKPKPKPKPVIVGVRSKRRKKRRT